MYREGERAMGDQQQQQEQQQCRDHFGVSSGKVNMRLNVRNS